jgi:superfamily I DNA/RNA helicase
VAGHYLLDRFAQLKRATIYASPDDSHRRRNIACRHQFSPPANIITLDRNYRSRQSILGAANGVIGLASEGFTKNLWTDRAPGARPQLVSVRDDADQARFIVERVLENRETGTLLKQQAVLFRASSHSGPLEIEARLLKLRSPRT